VSEGIEKEIVRLLKELNEEFNLIEIKPYKSFIVASGPDITQEKWDGFQPKLEKIKLEGYHIEVREKIDSDGQDPGYVSLRDEKRILGVYEIKGSTTERDLLGLYSDGKFFCHYQLLDKKSLENKIFGSFVKEILTYFYGERKPTEELLN